MRDKWNFLHYPRLTSGEQRWNLSQCNRLKSKHWKITNWRLVCKVFSLAFGQLVYWSKRAKEANLKESGWDNQIVSIQSPNGYLFHKVYFTICKWLTISVLCFETMFVWSWTDKSHWVMLYCSAELMQYGVVAVCTLETLSFSL